MLSVSIVLPCYNEEQAIPKVVSECVASLKKDFKKLHNLDIFIRDIIVVDDGSTDNSFNELSKFKEQIKILRHNPNKGYGAAIKTGISASDAELIAVFDLDCTCSAEDLHKLAFELINQNAEMAVGQRMGESSGMPIIRNLGNWIFSSITKLFFNSKHHDVCSGYRLFRRKSILNYMDSLKDDLSFCLGASLKFLMDQRKIVSVPINYKKRTGESKLSAIKEGPQFFSHIIYHWLQHKAK